MTRTPTPAGNIEAALSAGPYRVESVTPLASGSATSQALAFTLRG